MVAPFHVNNELKYGLEINKVYNEDCMVAMDIIKDNSIDMILCDLPYGITCNKWDIIIPLNDYIEIRSNTKKQKLTLDKYMIYCYKNDIDKNTCYKNWNLHHKKGLWTHYKRIIKENGAIVLTSYQPFSTELIQSNLELFKYSWSWEKSLKTNFLNAKKQPLRNHEDILVFYKKQPIYNPQGLREGSINGGNKPTSSYNQWASNSKKQTHTGYPSTVLKIANSNNGNIHPTQKPVELFEYLIKTYTNEGDMVLDNCMGSGTTTIACLNLNRNFIGFETDKRYIENINSRIQDFYRQKSSIP